MFASLPLSLSDIVNDGEECSPFSFLFPSLLPVRLLAAFLYIGGPGSVESGDTRGLIAGTGTGTARSAEHTGPLGV